jgi:caffeoyl-CoA O-methyltransferase
MNITPPSIEDYCQRHSSKEPALLLELTEETYKKTSMPRMLSGQLCGRFLKMLVQISQARRILEIGTFTGYSALSMAEGLPDDGKLITCDINEDSAKIARKYFAKSPHGHKIELVLQDAMKTISTLTNDYDLVFIDADKGGYKNYYEAALGKLKKGGIIVLDNTLWSSRVLDPKDADDFAIAAINDLISRDERVEHVLLPVRDGFHVVRKK